MALITTPRHLKQRAEFYREMAALLGAGVPALQALQQIARRPPSPDYRQRLPRAIDQIQSGATLTEALSTDPRWLPPLDLALLQAGEASGRLVESCRSLSQHYTDRARLVEGFLAKLLYPILLLHLALVIFPTDLLPALVWHGDVGGFVRQKLLVFIPLYLVGFLMILGLQARALPGWQALMEAMLRAVPGLGMARRELALARLASTLEALISAGVGIVEAWDLAGKAAGSPALQRTIQRWRSRVLAGEPPSEQLARSRVFPETFTNLYTTGEVSGQLDQELRHLEAYYRDSGTRRLERFALLLSILILLTVMGAIAFSVIQFWLGYYRGIFDDVGF